MRILIKSENIDLPSESRSFIEKKVGKLRKYFSEIIESHVTLKKEKYRYVTEITLHPKGVVLRGKGDAENLLSSFESALGKLEVRLRRWKEKISSHRAFHKGGL